ncbi:di-heme-cytochrome C peroxidase [Sphingosinicella sp. BN140058]|uniref:di-heme-cytochrome C peroxidase n=1 Tax=Sphingosinicella sp. BN140058 TaxID=1892855 RepID=UPI00101381FA|nr:di-heme-cytochrome C peroxidase [Sphingosinicella sp. BN140058]QAY76145.1 hypothetical protein ETR14_06085 [Sphingosinicella sp. BN140058]
MISTGRVRVACLFLSTALLAGTVACKPDGKPLPPGPDFTDTGWTEAGRTKWYEATQGSRLMPFEWFNALEQAESERPFRDDANLESFRFLTRKDALPAGFAVDKQNDEGLTFSKLRWYQGQKKDEPWIGLNCSACHTAQLSYKGELHVIDGGPSLLDFQSFIEALDRSLVATRNDAAKFDRFAKKVLKEDNPANRAMLTQALDALIKWQAAIDRMNNGGAAQAPIRYGFARLDAFGHIFNKVALLADAPGQTANSSDAPVSYPFLWDIYRQDRLQWNGIVTSGRIGLGGDRYVDFGAIGRNAGEVIGVFGDVIVKPMPSMGGFPSSLNVTNLDWLEVQLRHAKAPKWPASFDDPAVSAAQRQAMAASGRDLFDQLNCDACHITPPQGDSVYKVTMTPLRPGGPQAANNTDPWMACNAITYQAKTGRLQGRKQGYINGDPYGETAPLASMLATTVKGALLAKWKQIAEIIATTFIGFRIPPQIETATVDPDQARLEKCYAANNPNINAVPPFAYKGRPLDGVWATAPYLHNGSVPSLFDLMRAPADRPKSFQLGTREYDVANVGYRQDAAAPGNSFRFDTTLRGNSNSGHVYGVDKLNDDQRRALVEYLKTL